MLRILKHTLTQLVMLTVIVSSAAAGQGRQIAVSEGFQDPAVSPDGSQIAFALYGKIWLAPIGGGDARQVTSGSGWDSHPAWSHRDVNGFGEGPRTCSLSGSIAPGPGDSPRRPTKSSRCSGARTADH
jgi:hypothetical protein